MQHLAHSHRPALLLKKDCQLILNPQAKSLLTVQLLHQGFGLTGGLQHVTAHQAAGFQEVSPICKAVSELSSWSPFPIPNHLHIPSGASESFGITSLVARTKATGKGTRGHLGWQAAPQPRSLPHDTSARSPVRGPYSRAQATPRGRLESKQGGTVVTGTFVKRGPWLRTSEAEGHGYSPTDSSSWRKKASNVNG